MAKSSINIKNSSSSALLHNERVFSPSYLIDKDGKNEYLKICDIDNTVLKAKEDYKKFHNKKMHSKAQLIKEAVVNLNENHTLEDVKKMAQKLELKFGYKIAHIAIHRDEGHLDKDKNKVINYHAHIMMINYDFKTHRTVRPTKTTLAELQTFVAKELGMERGIDKRISKKERLEHKEYRQHAQGLEKAVEEITEKVAYSFRDFQAQITALDTENTELKKELHRLNTSVKKGETDVKELERRLLEERKKLEEDLDRHRKLYESATQNRDFYKERYEKALQEALKTQNEALSSLQSALDAQDAELASLVLDIESSTEYKLEPKEEHFNFIVRVVSSLFEKIQSLSSQLSSLLSKKEKESTEQEQELVTEEELKQTTKDFQKAFKELQKKSTTDLKT